MKRFVSLLCAAVIFVGMILYAAPVALAATAVTVTDAAGVNMREGPGTSYNKIVAIPAGTFLNVQQTQTADGYTWGKVDYDGKTGWIVLEFTDFDPSQTPSTPEPESKGKWVRENGNWYYYIDGAKATGWHKDAGKWYYMDADGIMQTGWLRLDGNWYYLNTSGVMQTGWLKQGSSTYYLNDKGVMQTGWIVVAGSHYFFESSGVMQTGWLQQGDVWYYLKADGSMAVGKAMIDGKANKFDKNGKWLGLAKYMTSNACVDLIKAEEGFSAKPYWDYAQYTVGYGTRCPDDKYDYYKTYGITTAEAEILLRDYLMNTEDSVESFINRYGLEMTPNQFDSLVMFSYNCGTAWTTETGGTFHNAIKNGATGSDLIRAYTLWCSAGGQILDGLVRRRLCEANMYLNGGYSQDPPANFCQVRYDGNGGKVTFRIQGYDSNETPAPTESATLENKYFAGWYTAKTGGTKVTKLTKSHNGMTLYAHWSDSASSNPEPSDPTPNEPQTNVVTVQVGDVLNVRKEPVSGDVVTKLTNGTQVVILELRTVDGYVWGRCAEGWIRLDYTSYDPNTFKFPGGWVTEGGKQYYIQNGKKVTGWFLIDNTWYYFNSTGAMHTGWKQDGKQWYYLGGDGKMQKGWLKYGNVWYYFNSSGVMQTGWLKLGNTTYYLDENGVMQVGLQKLDNKTYYFNGSGLMQTGLQTVNDKKYFFDSTGAMATGWQEVDSARYYFTAEGPIATGWQEIDGKRYYFDAENKISTGWCLVGGVWYYLDADGIMQTGWQRIGGAWYYLKTNGAMATGWLKDGRNWYYLNASGAMATGWLQLGKNWYYLKSSGEMVTGSYTIGPVTYKFDSNGVWIG